MVPGVVGSNPISHPKKNKRVLRKQGPFVFQENCKERSFFKVFDELQRRHL